MASSINSVVLVGRLTRDCEIKPLSNTNVCNFSLAVNRRTNQNGNWVDEAQYFDIELYGNLGPALQNYLLKGKQVAVEGSLRQQRWEAQDGQKRSRVSIVATNVQLLGGNANAPEGGGSFSTSQSQPTHNNSNDTSGNPAANNTNNNSVDGDFEDDIPF